MKNLMRVRNLELFFIWLIWGSWGMYQRIRHIMGYILRYRHSRPLCWPYTYRTLPIPHKVGTAMCLCSPPMGSEQKELCIYPGLAWSICRQMLSLTLPAGRWWPGSGEGKTLRWKIPGWKRTLPCWPQHPLRIVTWEKKKKKISYVELSCIYSFLL